ncbi:uncharacterized protein [Dermacentor andersoni]|uniref:uncharacterized protein isoform X3 n=1 Tax=Dermacentor andersoni TaxID=34620 RepID=UPI002416AEA9|nr:uncharacterized protein LOC126533817 isoform X3 [Dermacentor andersoni]
MPRNLLFLSVVLLGFVTSIVTYQNSQKGQPTCHPRPCQNAAKYDICCLIHQHKCVCDCVQSQRHCSAQSTQRCGLEGIPVCGNRNGVTTCRCVTRKTQKPTLPPSKPEIAGRRKCPPVRCLSPPRDEVCCFIKNDKCYCHCVESQRQCSAESTQHCGLEYIPICSNKYGNTTCHCAARGQNKPPLSPVKPQTSVIGQPLQNIPPSTASGGPAGAASSPVGTSRPSCSVPPAPCDVKTSKLCCLVMYPECHCKCVSHDTTCLASWAGKCQLPRVIDCDKTAGQRVCRCAVQRPQLEGLPPTTSSGGQRETGISAGGMNGRSCSLPSTPCDVSTTKLCCLVMYPECQCKCVLHQTACSLSWGEKCKAPRIMHCDKDAGQRVCRCASSPSG